MSASEPFYHVAHAVVIMVVINNNNINKCNNSNNSRIDKSACQSRLTTVKLIIISIINNNVDSKFSKNVCQPGLGACGASVSLPGRYGMVQSILCVLHRVSLSHGVEECTCLHVCHRDRGVGK